MIPLSFMEYWDESSDSDSDNGEDYSAALRFDDLVNRGKSPYDAIPWIYQFRSSRGAAKLPMTTICPPTMAMLMHFWVNLCTNTLLLLLEYPYINVL